MAKRWCCRAAAKRKQSCCDALRELREREREQARERMRRYRARQAKLKGGGA